MASQVFLSLLARNCRMLHLNPANPSNPSKHATAALGAAKFEAVASPVVPFLLQNYRLWPAKSFFFYWPETAGCSLQTLPTLQTLQTLQTPQTHRNTPNRPNYAKWFLSFCQTAAAKLAAVASLSVSTGPKLPHAPSKPCKPLKLSKRATAALGAAKFEAVASQVVPFLVHYSRLWQAKSFFFYWPETAGCSLQTRQTLQTVQCQTQVVPFLLPNCCCQTSGCGKSFCFNWPETAACSIHTLQTSQTLETCHSGSWSCQI